MSKQTFRLPVTWEMSGYVEVEADTLEDAVANFDADGNMPLPDQADYVDGSFGLSSENIDELRAMIPIDSFS